MVRYGNIFIGIVHRKYKTLNHPGMRYTHRVVIYGDHLSILDISNEFVFEAEMVEFCCGLFLVGRQMIVSYGIWDCKPILVRIDAAELLKTVGLSKWALLES